MFRFQLQVKGGGHGNYAAFLSVNGFQDKCVNLVEARWSAFLIVQTALNDFSASKKLAAVQRKAMSALLQFVTMGRWRRR
jgi:hypothetical protein